MKVKNGDKITLTIEATCMFDGKSGHIPLRFGDTTATLVKKKTQEKVGSVAGCMGGGVELMFEDLDKGIWFVNPQNMWEAFEKAYKSRPKKRYKK